MALDGVALVTGAAVAGPVPRAAHPGWTHRAAIGLLLTGPIAWIALILLGKALL